MKKLFQQFYRPTESEFRKLWKECFFALDANVLLNLYGYTEDTREQLLALFERLADRVFMPHQFVSEYQRNRAHAIMEQVKNYANAEKTLEQFYKTEIEPRTKHPHLSRKATQAFELVRQELMNSRKKHEMLFVNDQYFDRITMLVQNVGEPCSNSDLLKLQEQAKHRYANRIPPGFADKDKPEPEAFGDYIGWVQLMDYAKKSKRPAILITDDSKEDWWQIQSERTIGPRPELRAEFSSECSVPFYMYSSYQFMKFANTFLKERVRDEAIQEIQERMRERLRSRSDTKSVAPSFIQPVSEEKPVVPLASVEPKNVKPTTSEEQGKQVEQPIKSSGEPK